MKKISFGLSVREIQEAQKQIKEYKKDIERKCNLLAQKLAQEGVVIAKVKLMGYPAIDTGTLLNSIKAEPGMVITNGAIWYIYTDCEYAKYVEFGFGAIGSANPHPIPGLGSWKYDVNEHGEKGWWYFKNEEWHWSGGQPAKPFMYETGKDLRLIVPKIAKEVFGNG